MDSQIIIDRIKEKLTDAEVIASDMTGGGDHWMLKVTSKEFEGKTLVAQHRLVYDALGDLMKKEIHALALDTKTPE
jgi:stress-induced morphogen